MTSPTALQLRDQRTAEGKKLQKFIDELDTKSGEPTDADLAKLNELTAPIDRLSAEIHRAELAEGRAFLYSLGEGIDHRSTTGIGSKAAWAAEVATRLTRTVGDYGIKALTTGGLDIPQAVESSPVTMPVEPARVLDLLVGRKPLAGNSFEYLQQTARTSNAAPVADGATKPTSIYSFESVEDRARVFAHLTQPIPLRFLADHDEVRRVLADQLAEDLHAAIEEDALTGDGTGEHFTGLANTTGVRAQAYSVSVLQTLRRALTTLTSAGEQPNAWVMSHADLEAIDLTRENGATGGFLDSVDQKVFGNLPKIGTSMLSSGTAYLGDFRQARLYVRDGGRLDADVSGEMFSTNQTRLRYEGRFGFAVLRPAAFITIDLTA